MTCRALTKGTRVHVLCVVTVRFGALVDFLASRTSCKHVKDVEHNCTFSADGGALRFIWSHVSGRLTNESPALVLAPFWAPPTKCFHGLN